MGIININQQHEQGGENTKGSFWLPFAVYKFSKRTWWGTPIIVKIFM
jgi:hypothetical protein